MIKPQQLSRYLMLQSLEQSGRTSRGQAGLEKPGTWRKGPPGELAKNSQQPGPPAPPQPRPRLAPCKSPRSLICIHTSSFPYPPALGGEVATGWLTAALLFSHVIQGAVPSSFKLGAKKKRKGKKREGKGANPSRQRDRHHVGKRKKVPLSGVWTWEKQATKGQGLGVDWSRTS